MNNPATDIITPSIEKQRSDQDTEYLSKNIVGIRDIWGGGGVGGIEEVRNIFEK